MLFYNFLGATVLQKKLSETEEKMPFLCLQFTFEKSITAQNVSLKLFKWLILGKMNINVNSGKYEIQSM